MAWSDNLFYIAFLSQIFLLSYYFPNKLLARMRHILENYPPESYPRLYPKEIEHYKMAHLAFKYVCRFILLSGFVILFAVMLWVDHATFAITLLSLGYTLSNIDPDRMNFDVYRNDAAAT